jgi:PilZ domain-containing protein
MGSSSTHNRRWPRHTVEIPVHIVSLNGFLTQTVRGKGTNLNQGGMALRAGIPLDLGDVLHVEFLVPNRLKVSGVVRNRFGTLFGLEFLALLSTEGTARTRSMAPLRSTRSMATDGHAGSADPSPERDAYAILREKQLQIDNVKREIEALRVTARLLADD